MNRNETMLGLCKQMLSMEEGEMQNLLTSYKLVYPELEGEIEFVRHDLLDSRPPFFVHKKRKAYAVLQRKLMELVDYYNLQKRNA